jgi:hypothetical protein
MYDGSPAGPESSLAGDRRGVDWSTLWRFAADTGVTFFGAGAAFYASCLKADVAPQSVGNLGALRAIGATGSPLALECYDWIWSRLPQVDGAPIWLDPISGGTDFAGAFVAGMRTLPVTAGEMQCRCLGAAVEAWASPTRAARPLARRRGRRACLHQADAVDASASGATPAAAIATATSTCTRGSGARRLDPHHAARRRDHLRPQRRDDQPARYPHGHRRAVPRGRGCWRKWSTAWSSTSNTLGASYMPLFVVLGEGLVLDDAPTGA